ncbi:3-hydroxyisobutyryl-CoA hydrolase [Entomophthora muscae]|uniref:3-hydroxyisobutyryl-CoA hydrolase n=1 Tax=Entomophthora muscae TaxID=34485 RepID=A0ACC2UUY7_9FUNG|nr:3-hydroxyisobutyryl-CoA hydrolase [Entomophthora muscae]
MVVPRIKFPQLAQPTRTFFTLAKSPVRQLSFKMSSPEPAAKRLSKIADALSKKFSTSGSASSDGPVLSHVVQPTQPSVLHRKQFTGRTFILNRPKAYNALDLSMIRNIVPQLQAWDQSDLCKVITIKSSHPKAFCAGGDVKIAAQKGKDRDPSAVSFFTEEYKLNHMIGTLNTPFVALIDGITMGGGVGLSVHAPFRVATEKTKLAMPETSIGLFPDVGASFFLSRLDGELGAYLGLTGHLLEGREVMYAGFATHYVPSERLPALEDRLNELDSSEHDVVNQAIEEFCAEPDYKPSSLDAYRPAIDRCFAHSSVKDIIAALREETEEKEWAQNTIKVLEASSPTSLIVTLEHLRRGRQLNFAQCLQMEHNLVQHFLNNHDFPEGVESKLVLKGSRPPQWQPASLAEADEKLIIRKYFESAEGPSLTFEGSASKGDFMKYPYSHFTLPTEEDVKDYLTHSSISLRPTVDELLNHFMVTRDHKVGIKTQLISIIQRCCEVDYSNKNEVFWNKKN